MVGPMIPKSSSSFQTLRLKIHERQRNFNTIFFSNIKMAGTKDVSIASWSFFHFLHRQLITDDRSFEFSVCNFEIYNEIFLITVLIEYYTHFLLRI